ncbi:Scn1a [Symbiodinium sp. CCMP2456]|nr:Scn1a [Symbiodinium sp. CCMP2456]
MAKRHLAGMVRSSPNVVKFDSEPEESSRPNSSPSTRPPRAQSSNAWHDVMEMCRKGFTTKMNSVGNEILQDVRSEVQRAVAQLKYEISSMLEAREKTSSNKMESVLLNIDKLQKTTEEGVMNIHFDLSPVLQEMQRVNDIHVEDRKRLEGQMEKLGQQMKEVQVRADLEEERLQKLLEKQEQTESLIVGVQKFQDMLALSIEQTTDEVQKSGVQVHQDYDSLVAFNTETSRQLMQRLEEPLTMDTAELHRELKKNQAALSGDFRMVLSEIGKIQQALHLDFAQRRHAEIGKMITVLFDTCLSQEQKRPSLPPVEAACVEAPSPEPKLVEEPKARAVPSSSAQSGAQSMGVGHVTDKEMPRSSLKHSATAPADKDESTLNMSMTSELVYAHAKRGSVGPGMNSENAFSAKKHKRVREFWSQTEPNPVETTAVQTDPVKFQAQRGRRSTHPNGEKTLAAPKPKPKPKPQRVFQDAEAMKQKARQARVKPQYNVFDRYYKTGCAQFVAKHWLFEYATLVVVCLNTVWIAIDTDLNTFSIITNAPIEFQIAENFFCGYFFCELLIRFCAFQQKRHCLQDYWFLFDLFLVVLMVAETWIVPLVFNALGLREQDLEGTVNTDLLRILRLVRILRLSRMAKLLRAVPELVIIIKGIGFAARSVVVFFMLWTMIIYVFAILLRQLTQSHDVGPKYFSSVSHSMMTLFLNGIVPNQANIINEVGVASWAFWLILVCFVLLASVTIMYMLVGVLVEVMTVISATEKEGMTVSADSSKPDHLSWLSFDLSLDDSCKQIASSALWQISASLGATQWQFSASLGATQVLLEMFMLVPESDGDRHCRDTKEVPLSQREFQALLVEEEHPGIGRKAAFMKHFAANLCKCDFVEFAQNRLVVHQRTETEFVIYEDMNKLGKSTLSCTCDSDQGIGKGLRLCQGGMTFENLVDTILNLRGKNTATVKDVKEQARVIKSMVQHTLNANGNKVMEEFQVLRTELAALREEALRRDEDEDAEADDFNALGFQMEETEPFPANSRALPGNDANTAEKIPREREAWRRLLARVAQLRGYPKAEALLQEKHAELPAITFTYKLAQRYSSDTEDFSFLCYGAAGAPAVFGADRSFYTAMNLASRDITVDTQSPRYWELLDVWRKIDGNQVLSQQASSQCPVGYLTLKLLGFVSLRAEVILEELLKLEGVMIHPILRCLASTLDWHKVADLGWPLFRLLARVESPAHEELGMTNPLNTWSEANWLSEMPYLELVQRHLDEGIAVPAAASGLLLSYPDRISPYSRATALLALAEVLRPPRVAPDLVGEAERLIRRAVYILTEDFLAPKYPPLVPLTSRWPIFQLADRLACKGEVRWNLPAQAARSRPRVAVLPMPEKVSDVVRSCSLPYCDLNFFELVLRAVAASARKKLHLVEVGANLGDCTFWVAAHLGRRLASATAVEPVPSAAAAVRRSITINGWDFIQVVQAVAGAKAGEGSMYFLAHSAGNPYASASAVALRNVETPSVPARMTTVASLLSSQPRPGTARLLKLYAYADLLDVLKGARSAARKVDAVWLAFAAGLLPRARSAAVAMFAFFYRQAGWSCQVLDLRASNAGRLVQKLAAAMGSGAKATRHLCVPILTIEVKLDTCEDAAMACRNADQQKCAFHGLCGGVPAAGASLQALAKLQAACTRLVHWQMKPEFGIVPASRKAAFSVRPEAFVSKALKRSYFLGDEELELEQQIRGKKMGASLTSSTTLMAACPSMLILFPGFEAQHNFQYALACALQLQGMGHELIGRDAIERVSEALTQGTAEEGPLVCSMLAKELEGTRFDHHWVSQDGKGRYRLGEDGMKVAVQVLDGKLLIHGYFEGSLVHPVRIPILAFLTEHGKTSEKQPEDDCDLFGQAAPATGEKEGGQIRLRSRSRSPRPSKVQETPVQQSGPLPLPPGWVKKESRSKPGVFYYANEAKGLTQFERPTS